MTGNDDITEMLNALSMKQSQLAESLVAGNTQMRSLAKRVWKVQEDERKHIARELHDGVGQLLTALINQVEQTLKDEKDERLQQSLKESLDLARQALHDTRKISRLMRPRILDDLGLEAALKWLRRIMQEQENLSIELEMTMQQELDEETQTLVFRIVQEALTNAIKHAKANNIKVEVASQSTILLVKIIDDGIGMDKEKALGPDGFGLSAMQDRVAAFGGQLMIDSSVGKGTEVKMLLMG
ncbi:sensor histidine kinase [Kangiella sediminilitoris]|uniref:Oxygen sensor histidine kinase NreB n=1 Tax=Kangiella sediminilitoris TaxID=1144748 RepID=A0A1B3BAK6_9GAMM|nr:sensor histidine kinase [Kangiella sediminilitoris]AOE49823.1 Histidine kinase [Kangiella sediminilitoris]